MNIILKNNILRIVSPKTKSLKKLFEEKPDFIA